VSEVESAEEERGLRGQGTTSSGETAGVGTIPEETSLFGFLSILLKYRVAIVVAVVVIAALAALLALLPGRTYTARASFTPRSGRAQSQMTALASQFGLTLNLGGDATQSGNFYEGLLGSSTVLRPVAEQTYVVRTTDGKTLRGELAAFYGLKGRSASIHAEAVRRLQRHVRTASSPRSGMVFLFVKAPYPELALQLTRNILASIDAFNLDRQRQMAAAERDFVEKRLGEARGALQRSEDELRRFRELNRSYRTSPQLAMDSWRMERDVVMRQQFYTSLAGSYEQARIEAVRDLPATVIVEAPELPAAPDPRAALRKTLLGGIAGLLFGIMLAFVRERLDETRTGGTPAFRQYQELKRGALSDLVRPWRPVGRLLRSSGR